MTNDLDRARIDGFLDAVCQRVDGDVVLVGGALVATWLEPRRVTEDIDIVPLGDRQELQLRLWDVAEACGLPIESVNGAAEFFLRRIPGWEQRLVEHRRGSRGRILRPDPTLFLLTKIGRLSERDLADCELILDRSEAGELQVEGDVVRSALALLAPTDDAELSGRRARLGGRLSGGGGART